jgi:hypothetical protein
MRLMCWDMDIVHRYDIHLTDADYWSRLGADICFNPHFKEYLDFSRSLWSQCPAPVDLPMRPENMPYYRGPHLIFPPTDTPNTPEVAKATYCPTLISTIALTFSTGMDHLSNVPVHFGKFKMVTPLSAHLSTNDEFPCLAQQILFFNWAVYSFGGGHFVSTIQSQNLPFRIALACDQVESGRALFHEFTSCPHVFGNRKELLNHILALGDSPLIHGYSIHLLQFKDSKTTATFWKLQSTIVSQLRSLWDLQMIVAIILLNHDKKCVKPIILLLKRLGWVTSLSNICFPDIGDGVAGECRILTFIHNSCGSTGKALDLMILPRVPPWLFDASIWESFNKPEHSVSWARTTRTFVARIFNTAPGILHHHHHSHPGSRYVE